MRIQIVTPARAGSTYGNRITAVRWASILKQLGHRVTVTQTYDGETTEMLVALHARRSYQSIKRLHQKHPSIPIVVALTGTDVYRDLKTDRRTMESLEIAAGIVALQPKALDQLKRNVRSKARVIYQSAERVKQTQARSDKFDVCVIAHLRPVKDPFRAALATRLLPASSRIQILQIGKAMTDSMLKRAQAEANRNRRYRWLGELSRSQAQSYLVRSRVCVISSRMEGGANVLSEAIVTGVPVLASRIDGNVSILGDDYPGLFNVGDTRALANLLDRVETDSTFLHELRKRTKRLAPLFDREREIRAWAELITALAPKARNRLARGSAVRSEARRPWKRRING
jgi:putative glycosyltransferase (TIGR04348 family)